MFTSGDRHAYDMVVILSEGVAVVEISQSFSTPPRGFLDYARNDGHAFGRG
ncbi:MAG: hypothetical protein IKC64_00510 [Clostridia bacterium]|nr:hypothetical protein [Clostridia bacterium]